MTTPCEGSRDIGDGIIVSLTPDVCKTPVGSSMVPVPYSITAKQADDANTVATVRFTKKRAHNMASLVTKCTGDAPGTGTGIKSGTVGSVCHPKSHSNNVRIKGEWAIRDGDTWYMNNKNTVGKLTYVKSKQTFEETPAILLTQKPDSLLPEGTEHSDMVNAILGGMERAQAEGMPAGSYQVAQAGTPTMTDATISGAPPNTGGAGALQNTLRNLSRSPLLNRIARHPAARIALMALEEATMTQSEREIQQNAMGVFMHPAARQIAVDHDLIFGGMPGFNPFNFDHWSQDMGVDSKYGAFVGDAEKILYANDVLTHAAGYPVDIRTTSAAEIDRILGNYAAMREEETRAESEVTDGNVRVAAQAEEIDCFNVPEGVDREEFERQLKEQQDEINNTDIDTLQARRQRFRDGEAKRDRRAQREARREWIRDRRKELMNSNPPMAFDAAEAAAQQDALLLDATHVIDMVAGGNPSTISGLGNSRVNRSIGSQWRGRRVQQLDGKLAEQKAQGKTKPEIELELCD